MSTRANDNAIISFIGKLHATYPPCDDQDNSNIVQFMQIFLSIVTYTLAKRYGDLCKMLASILKLWRHESQEKIIVLTLYRHQTTGHAKRPTHSVSALYNNVYSTNCPYLHNTVSV